MKAVFAGALFALALGGVAAAAAECCACCKDMQPGQTMECCERMQRPADAPADGTAPRPAPSQGQDGDRSGHAGHGGHQGHQGHQGHGDHGSRDAPRPNG